MTDSAALHTLAARLLGAATAVLVIGVIARGSLGAKPNGETMPFADIGASGHVTSAMSPAVGRLLLGIDPEATETIAVTGGISLVLAALLTRRATSVVLVATIVVAAFFVALDAHAMAYQEAMGHPPIRAITVVTVLLHVGVIAVAGLALALRSRRPIRIQRRYAPTMHHEQDWVTGSLPSLVKIDSQRHQQESSEQHRPERQNGHHHT